MKKLLLVSLLLASASIMQAGDANWPMGSPNGSWQMGTPDGSWAMGSSGTVSGAPSVANLRDVRIGFTAEQVLRLLGAPSTMDTTRTAYGRTDYWFYRHSDVLAATIRFDDGLVSAVSY
jgi:SmpA / OmlA family